MRAVFLNDEEADLNTISAENFKLVEPRVRINRGVPEEFHVYPKGCEVSGAVALHIATSGQGHPLDDECVKASGLNPAQLRERQKDYEMTAKGINRPEDRILYKAGVIAGYDTDGEYIHGPNWDSYHEQMAKAKEASDE